MGQKEAAAHQPQFKSSPLLAKPGKRSRHETLPSALHMGVCVSLSLLVFAIINICVTELLGRSNPYTRLVQSGTMMAMLTITVLGTPNLGNSFTKAFQRIVGAMIGGWLFYGLYAACQQWWFLVICLTVWGFVLVALSFWLSGREFLFPVALVTSFIVACNFNSVHQAMVMTLVKTVAFSGAVVVYTLLSLVVFPLTATQQLMTHLALALEKLQQLSVIVLVAGEQDGSQSEAHGAVNGKDVEAQMSLDGKDVAMQTSPDAAAAASDDQSAQRGRIGAGKAGKQVKQLPAGQSALAASLAADANNHLQLVQQLLGMTKKERYVGSFGAYKCFLPTVLRKSGRLPEHEVLAVVVNAAQVLRVLLTILSEFGAQPIAKRSPPTKLSSGALRLMQPLAQQAVAALQDISAGLPATGSSSHCVPISNLQSYSDTLRELVAVTLQYDGLQPAAADFGGQHTDACAAPAGVEAPADSSPGTAEQDVAGGGSRWQKAAATASGLQLPSDRAQQLALNFSSLLTASVCSEEGQLARWFSVLVLGRELGRAVAGLNDSMNEMLAKLPWLTAGTVV